MPCNYKDYPANWKWLSSEIIADADNRCTLCYAPNKEFIYRDKNQGHPWDLAENLDETVSKTTKFTRVILTVHHIDSDKTNNTKANLIALCQRCHLRLDMQKHIKKRNEAKR